MSAARAGGAAREGKTGEGQPRLTEAVGAAYAKAHLLAIMEAVHESGIPVVVTRRGVPHVQIAPVPPQEPPGDIFGCLKGTVTITGDVIGPEPDVWEAMQ